MLRTIRLSAAIVCFTLITLLFLDFTGTLHTWFGWLAKIQFLPALLALNIGVVLFLIVFTFLFGRIYCSVICPKQSGFNPMYFNVANLIREICFSTIQITECFTNFTDK